jgi:uncharacterized RDD family membrane protein YckC
MADGLVKILRMAATRHRDTSLGTGVFYAAGDYVGMGRRIVILIIDSLVLAILLFCVTIALALIRANALVSIAAIFGTFWAYEAVLKRSAMRTLGYRLTGSRIVNLQGQRPSLFALTFRSLLWMFGPFNLLFDLLWCGIDDDRQTLRDRFAETYLIHESATPIGTGEIHLTYFDVGLFHLYYPRVNHPQTFTGAHQPTAHRASN